MLLHLLPNDRLPLLHVDATHVDSIALRPKGFEPTASLHLPAPPPVFSQAGSPADVTASSADAGGGGGGGDGTTATMGTSQSGEEHGGGGRSGILAHLYNGIHHSSTSTHSSSETTSLKGLVFGSPLSATLQELAPGRATVTISIQHGITATTGAHLFRFSCGMWIYNCAGIPISLRDATQAEALRAQTAAAHAAAAGGPDDDAASLQQMLLSEEVDDVPDSWVPPLQLPLHDAGDGFATVSSTITTPTTHHNLMRHQGEATGVTPSPAAAAAASGGDGFAHSSSVTTTTTTRRGSATPVTGGGVNTDAPPGLSSTTMTAAAAPARSMQSIAGSMFSIGQQTALSGAADVPGLSEILERDAAAAGGAMMSGRAGSFARNRVLASPLGIGSRPPSRARGIADSMDSSPTFERPSEWPSMASGPAPTSVLQMPLHHLYLQLRVAPSKAPPGRTFWSQRIDLDASGGAVVTSIPSPGVPTAAAAAAAATAGATGSSAAALRGAYPVVVTATQVPGADGVLALCISPRFLLRNHLDVPIQYKQQDAHAGEREVLPGGVRAVQWSDENLPQRLCVRVQEAGWMWSGGFQLDAPGDIFVKIRHRDRGITKLVRVGVASAASGVCYITLSHNPTGFAPYRVENCSLETLHARQKSVREQQDVLRPYCALYYAWDEPTEPHQLVLELPGARHLGTFDLDKVRNTL